MGKKGVIGSYFGDLDHKNQRVKVMLKKPADDGTPG
jgi:hypothetical protein